VVRFFVPDAQRGDSEAAYHRLAALAGVTPAPSGRRVRQASLRIGRESWTVTVGEKPRGTRPQHSRRRGEFTTTFDRLSDPATVLAIFAHDRFTVVTDAEPVGASPSGMENPLSVAKATAVLYFLPDDAR